jgi:dipeptidyl aminopeptidase/acylaminoacyl peptidase
MSAQNTRPGSPAAEALDELLDATRLGGLATTPGGRVVASVSRPDVKGTAYHSGLVEILGWNSRGTHTAQLPVVDAATGPGAGSDAARGTGRLLPLTRGNASAGGAVLLEDGTTLFTSKRVGEDGSEADEAQLWALPPRGEAREIASRPGGFSGIEVVEDADGTPGARRLFAQFEVHSQAADEAEHAELSTTRKDAKVTAALHDDFPTRFWNHDLGPTRPVLAVAELPSDLTCAEPTADPVSAASAHRAAQAAADGAEAPGDVPAGAPGGGVGDTDDEDVATPQLLHFRYVDLPAGRLGGWVVNRQGTAALVAMNGSVGDLLGMSWLYLVDLTDAGAAPRLLREPDADREYSPGEFSPDGRFALIGREQNWTPTASTDSHVELLDVATGDSREIWSEHDYWVSPVWLDDVTLVASSADQGRGSVWIGGLEDAAPRRLAGGPDQDLAFGGLQVAAGQIVTTASGICVAPFPVRIDPATGQVTPLANPAEEVVQTGTLTEVATTAADGTALRAWLRLPEGEGPHPLVVFAHGGPWGSWNAFTFRWNPNPFVAAGYAVLLPDPAISTGYGQHMIDRGQQELGGAPFADIMALADATIARSDIDESRQAFAGGSYGGYMANWVAGHTGDRFRCIITHSGAWHMESKNRTNDNSSWERGMRSDSDTYSPHHAVADIQVPMLITHGARDYRVPIGQAHWLWYDLNAFSATPRDEAGRTRHRFLYFPDEGHWILGRGNAQVWYETFIGFLDQHVHGTEWDKPATLG